MLVTFIGNHDQMRFVSETGSSLAKLKAAFGLLLTLRGIPQIYSGDEIAMPGGNDPDNRHDFPGGFPGDAHNAFTAGGRTAEQQDAFAYVQSLLKLRQKSRRAAHRKAVAHRMGRWLLCVPARDAGRKDAGCVQQFRENA